MGSGASSYAQVVEAELQKPLDASDVATPRGESAVNEVARLRKLIAIGGPAFVQLYVGNVLEPAVFGKSLNVTAISVLVALVLWGSIWGLQGAVLSVPLLAATKIALEEADHPMAKMILRIIRESAAVDDSVEQGKSRKDRKLQRKATQAKMKEAMSGPTASGAGGEASCEAGGVSAGKANQ